MYEFKTEVSFDATIPMYGVSYNCPVLGSTGNCNILPKIPVAAESCFNFALSVRAVVSLVPFKYLANALSASVKDF